ncbi:helix-turn-helix domain-containing protein [Alkalihalobacillus oceani]|uniref:Helix-turn-helix domain-containing protein n=1 Tax=Halalkalibacter oceani TaxID=1653776 RepID=A0A9X2DPX3_9BACI|nr:helix-turn-helix transcriptional regulator [Halalkalibacter oceani]MCM3712933.1 helix-turn-helix domain-containing protein [Halalkalibacter oceani]
MFSQRLRALRLKHGLTMKALGKQLNVAPSTISGYENGNRKPDMETLQKLADFFHSSTDYLIGRTDNPAPLEHPEELKLFYSDTITDEEINYLKESLAVFRKYRAKQ